MSKVRWNPRTDDNQKEIVKILRQIPGVSVEVNHDDILVGYRGVTYWYEIKQDAKKTLTKSEQHRLQNWDGHYKVVWDVQQILDEILRK